VLGKAPPPVADNARLDTYFRGNRTRAAPLRRQYGARTWGDKSVSKLRLATE
jgi:hypothetical protein